jgi:cytoskeletal protein RodZ
VFEIGNSLREARLRQSLELSRVEVDTKIRGKYLHALEDERFSVIPGETYVKGFLRAYAEYLGLDGQLYVDEFNSRFASAEDATQVAPAAPMPKNRHRARRDSNLVVVALAGIVAVAVLVVVAWQFGSTNATVGNEPLGASPGQNTTTAGGATTTQAQAPAPKRPRKARLVVSASRGDCWLLVRTGSSTGPLLFEGTLAQGRSMRFTKKRLWMQVGAPDALLVKLNGHRAKNFPTGSSTVVVTPTHIRTVSAL